MKYFAIITLIAMLFPTGAHATEDWTYSRQNVALGASTAKEKGLCAKYNGATRSVCWGLKNAIANTCAEMASGPAQYVCLGVRQSHKKAPCADVADIGLDFCVAYTSALASEGTCANGPPRQIAICQGLVEAFTEDKPEPEQESGSLAEAIVDLL
jgi:hypothetical protein